MGRSLGVIRDTGDGEGPPWDSLGNSVEAGSAWEWWKVTKPLGQWKSEARNPWVLGSS